MKYHKQMICLLYFLMLFAFDTFAMKQQKQQFSYFAYLSHPTTLFCTGLTTLGAYCLYDKEASLHAYDWLKQRFDEAPGLVKIGGFGLGLWTCYKLWFNKKSANVFDPGVNIPHLNEQLITVEEIKDFKERLDVLEKNQEIIKIYERLKVLENGDIETKVLFAAWEAQNNQVVANINKRLNPLEEDNTENEELKKSFLDLIEGLVNEVDLLKAQASKSLVIREKEAEPQIELITLPKQTLLNWAQRLDNLEIIVLGRQTNEDSFGVDAPLNPSRIDLLEKDIVDSAERFKAIEENIKDIKSIILRNNQSPPARKKFLPSPHFRKGSASKGDEGEKHN